MKNQSFVRQSFWPLIQTAIAVVFYWAIAIFFNTHIHLFFSVFIAFFLLLRSKTSIKYGRSLFLKYIEHDQTITLKNPFVFCIIFLVVLGTIFWISALTIQITLDSNHITLSGLSFGFFPVFASSFVSITLTTLLVGSRAGIIAGIFAGRVAYSGAKNVLDLLPIINAKDLTHSISSAVDGANIGKKFNLIYLVSFALIVSCVFIFNQEFELAWWFIGGLIVSIAATYFKLINTIIFGLAIASGILIRSIVIRIIATARFCLIGIRKTPENFKDVVFNTSIFDEPEIIPGILKDAPYLSITNIAKLQASKHSLSIQLLGFLAYIAFLLPAVVYRLTLKSTAWFYYIFVYWNSNVRLIGREATIKTQLLYDGRAEKLRRCLAVIVASSTIFTTLSLYDLVSTNQTIPKAPFLIKAFLAVDLKSLSPWHLCNILNVFITFIIWLFSENIKRHHELDKEINPTASPSFAKVRQLILLHRARNVLTFLFFLLAASYLLIVTIAGSAGVLELIYPDWLFNRIQHGSISI